MAILIHFTFVCMEVGIHRQFQSPGEPCERATHASRSEFCLVFSLIVFQATPAENVWPPRSKSVRSQVSAALWTMAFVCAWICTDDTRASRQQAKGQRCYLSQNIGLVVAGSAGPAPERGGRMPNQNVPIFVQDKARACTQSMALSIRVPPPPTHPFV